LWHWPWRDGTGLSGAAGRSPRCGWMIPMTSLLTLTVEPTPSGPDLTLRPWRDSDASMIVAAHRDEAMRRWLMRPIADEDEARAWIAEQDAAWVDGTRMSWAVEADGTAVGYFAIKAANPPASFATGVGYWTVPEARGKGIASRCVEAATEWLFGGQDMMPADEIELLHKAANVGSCRVAQKCGYALDSVLPPTLPKYREEGHRHLRKRPAPLS
jgi:RimJ/RimL family protein N-acetyltransferase